MRIPKDNPTNYWKLSLACFIIFIVLIALYFLNQKADAKANFFASTPELGRITTSINAYGSLQPKSRYSILGFVGGNIQSISLRPGDKVLKNDPIITLMNPKLIREAEQAQLSLLGEHAVLEKLRAMQKMDLSRQKAQLQLTEYDLTIALSRMLAKRKLAQQNIISVIDLQEIELQYDKANLLVKLEKEAITTLVATQAAELKSQQFHLQRAEKQLELLQKDIENLVIRAGINGVIVKLDSELEEGLTIDEGKSIGQIADPQSLYALLRVQASQASLLALQQSVDISLKGKLIKGAIERISPNVENSTVEIEVRLNETLPDNAMTNMAITASIHIESAQESMLLAKLPHINYSGANSVVVKSGQQYVTRKIIVGWVGEDQIEIIDGLSMNEKVLSVSPDKWEESASE